MKVLILGATGRVGQELVKLALADGHEVTALVRSAEKVRDSEIQGLRVHLGDARSIDAVLPAMRGVEAVLCALNTDGETMLSESMAVVLDAMQQLAIRRLVTIGTAGILQSRVEPHLLRYRSSESRRTTTAAAEDHERAYHLLAASDLDWTLVCPTYLPDGPPTEQYRVERDRLPIDGKRITTGDTAHFAYRQLTSVEFLKCRVGIAE